MNLIDNKKGFSPGIVIGSITAIVVIVSAAVFFILKNTDKPVASDAGKNNTPVATSTKNANRLPGTEGGDGTDGLNSSSIQAEKMTFADFYKKSDEKIEIKNIMQLPINVKTDPVNYYDVTRVINLDKHIDTLNSNGIAIVDNQFKDSVKDFYGVYDFLAKKNLPLLITSDFVQYYYQNSLRDIYSKIQDGVFYSELWKVNKKMFDSADAHYRARKLVTTGANDPYLEGAKLEAGYFAVALELLKPKPDQTNLTDSTAGGRFSSKASAEFSFQTPEYIAEMVGKETGYIYGGTKEYISPVFLYKKDYSVYKLPKSVSDSSKLSNFYLVTNWLNSVFPLYYKGGYCPECLLDKDDWAVNNIAVSFIANDFSTNQETKNQWAKIYKVISFFQGLRSELSYLHYYDALVKTFGSDYKLDDIFPADRTTLNDNLTKLQSEAIKYDFAEIEGGLDRQDPGTRAVVGMRMLQDGYSPDNYIFGQLTHPNVTVYTGTDKIEKVLKENGGLNSTICMVKGVANRCRGTGLDIVNLIYPITDNKFFTENTKYENYAMRFAGLKDQISRFNTTSWHNSSFWSLLNFANVQFYPEQSKALFQAPLWRDKNMNSFLGSWVNLMAVPEKIENRWQFDSMADSSRGNNYVEPNIDFLNESLANVKMLKDALTAFRAIKEKDPAMEKINDVYSDIEKLRNIAKKELADQQIDYEDNKAIMTIAEKFQVKPSDEKRTVIIKYKSDNIGTEENITGIKFFVMVYPLNGKKYMAVGPIFNYKEGR